MAATPEVLTIPRILNFKRDLSVNRTGIVCACVCGLDQQRCGSPDPRGGKCDFIYFAHLAVGIMVAG